MKFVISTLSALSLLVAPMAEAKPGNGRGNGHGARSEEGFCPPGLAKRDPACIPPGQVDREDRDVDEARPERERQPDRDASDRDASAEPQEPDPIVVLLDLLDDMPVRGVEPSDAAVLDLPLEPMAVTVPAGRPVDLDGRSAEQVLTPVEPVTDTEAELGEVFRRATEHGSVGY